MSQCFDRNGDPMSVLQWAMVFEDNPGNVRQVVLTTIDDGSEEQVLVSTVWLGLDHGFGGRPLIFETAVINAPAGSGVDVLARYSTEAEAIEGHALIVSAIRRALALEAPPSPIGLLDQGDQPH